MAHKELCQHCGASMMKNFYTFNKTLLRALAKVARNPGQPIRDVGLTKSEYANVSKLKFWGFLVKADDGLWTVTELGLAFLRGQVAADKEIAYFRNEVVERQGKVFVWDIISTEESKQKYREFMQPYL